MHDLQCVCVEVAVTHAEHALHGFGEGVQVLGVLVPQDHGAETRVEVEVFIAVHVGESASVTPDEVYGNLLPGHVEVVVDPAGKDAFQPFVVGQVVR